MYSFVADYNTVCCQHLLDSAQAKREAKAKPEGVVTDLSWKAVAGIAGAHGRSHPVRLPALLPIRNSASSQIDGAGWTKGSADRAICVYCSSGRRDLVVEYGPRQQIV